MQENEIHILFAEDDRLLRNIVSQELSGEGYHVLIASDGSEAMSMLPTNNFRVILLDIKMPDVDGFTVLAFIKRYFPSVKVIMLTGYADSENALRAKQLGADGFLAKPYDLEDLLTTIACVINSSGLVSTTSVL